MKTKYIIPFLALGFLLTSCKKLVEVLPQNSLATSVALTDVNGYQALLISVYDRIQDFGYYGRDLALEGDVLADNAFVSSGNGTRYLTTNTNSRGAIYDIWSNAYSGINELNNIIVGIDGISTINTTQALLKQQIKSEAYALRGLIYFDIARIYGYEPNTIPTIGTGAGFDKSAVLRLTPTLVVDNATLQNRATITETYAQIEKDLSAAITNFQALTQLSGYSKPTTPYRITESATHALLGKVYLYERKYSNASTEFDNALNSNISFARAAGAGGYVSAFKTIPNPESLFEINFNQALEMSGVTGVNNSLFTYTQPSNYTNTGAFNGLSTYGTVTASAELVALFGSTDDRRAMFFNSRSANTSTNFTWVNKYSGAGGAYTDDVPIIRYSDVVLMKAEALANLGSYAVAGELIRTLRTNRNASTAGVPTDATLLAYIQDERRRELFFEGHRWFDLKRLGNGITKPAATAVGTIAATDYRILGQVLTSEVNLNPSLPQNPGY
ncbi:MAG: RagB/SusD family nutrient uptake outer membrane protein [Sphingobacteriaceae bacterium]|nr:MAG: RagB/SusD family nutrient uptake outer membrane protein [Sphingobacteriaceae bacterium]